MTAPRRARPLALACAALLAACAVRPVPPLPPAAPIQPAPPPAAVPQVFDFQLKGAIRQGGLILGTAPPGARLSLEGRPVRLAPDGRFLIGLARDAGPSARLEALTADGRILMATLAIAPQQWQVDVLPTLRQRPSDSPAYAALRAEEVQRILAARSASLDNLDWQQPFIWPAAGRISAHFGSQRILGGVASDPHGGMDIAVPQGTPVHAPAGGRITLASPPDYSLEGNMVFIDHGYGLSSAFLHLSRVDVRPGDRVEQGQVIGLAGMTGRATGPHIHWGMVWNGVRVDPESLLPPAP